MTIHLFLCFFLNSLPIAKTWCHLKRSVDQSKNKQLISMHKQFLKFMNHINHLLLCSSCFRFLQRRHWKIIIKCLCCGVSAPNVHVISFDRFILILSRPSWDCRWHCGKREENHNTTLQQWCLMQYFPCPESWHHWLQPVWTEVV